MSDCLTQYTSAQDLVFGTDLSNNVTISKGEHDHLVRSGSYQQESLHTGFLDSCWPSFVFARLSNIRVMIAADSARILYVYCHAMAAKLFTQVTEQPLTDSRPSQERLVPWWTDNRDSGDPVGWRE